MSDEDFFELDKMCVQFKMEDCAERRFGNTHGEAGAVLDAGVGSSSYSWMFLDGLISKLHSNIIMCTLSWDWVQP